MGPRLTALLPRVGFGALVVAAFAVPVVFLRAAAEPFAVPKATVVWLARIVAVAGIVVATLSRRQPPMPRLRVLIPMALLVGWTALATVFSVEPMRSALGQYGRCDGLLSLVIGVVVSLSVVAYTWRAPERLDWLAVAVAASGIPALGYVVVERFGWDWIDWAFPDPIIGLSGNPNFSGAHLALVVPFVLGVRSRSATRWVRLVLLAFAVALACGVWWTGTRGGIVALVAGVAAFGLLAPDLLPRAGRVAAVVATVLLLGIVLSASMTDAVPGRQALGSPAVLQSSGLAQRRNIWSGAIDMVVAHPLLGVGPDAFGLRFPYVRSPRPDGRAVIDADEAHNVFLDRAATAGLPALGAYLWLVGSVGWGAWRVRRRIDPSQRWLLGSFGGALGGYLLQGAFSIDVVPLAFLSWLGIGALVALSSPVLIDARTAAAPDAERAATLRPVPVPALAVVVVVALGASVVAVRPLQADVHERRGMAAAAGDPGRSLRELTAAANALGHEPRYHQRLAAELAAFAAEPDVEPALRRTFLRESLVAYDHALARASGDVSILEAQAEVHLLAAEAAVSAEAAAAHLDAAGRILRRLLASADVDDTFHLPYGRVYEARARLGPRSGAGRARAAAAQQYEQARRYRPDRVPALEGLARLAVADGQLRRAREFLVEATKAAPPSPALTKALSDLDRRIREQHP